MAIVASIKPRTNVSTRSRLRDYPHPRALIDGLELQAIANLDWPRTLAIGKGR
jgi:hypothetical protein